MVPLLKHSIINLTFIKNFFSFLFLELFLVFFKIILLISYYDYLPSCAMWDPSCPTKDRTCAPCNGSMQP